MILIPIAIILFPFLPVFRFSNFKFQFLFQKLIDKRLKISDMRFATKRLLFIGFIHKLQVKAFNDYFHLKNLLRRIVIKSELVLSLLSISF